MGPCFFVACELKMDLALIADNSGSIDIVNYPILQQFLVSLVEQIHISQEDSRVKNIDRDIKWEMSAWWPFHVYRRLISVL